MPAQHTHALHYHNGHFYDPETRQRLLLRDGAELLKNCLNTFCTPTSLT